MCQQVTDEPDVNINNNIPIYYNDDHESMFIRLHILYFIFLELD